MNALAARGTNWPVFAVVCATAVALVGTAVVGILHARVGHSVLVATLIVTSFAASLIGAIGGLILANLRRNVMWILALALATTALMALLAIVISSFGPT